MLLRKPQLLGYSVANRVQHTATHCNTLQHTATQVLQSKPQLLGYSIAQKLRPTVAFFRHELGLSQAAVAGMVVRLLLCVAVVVLYSAAATHCNILQHTATRCNILQHTATRSVQHTAATHPGAVPGIVGL